MAQSHADAVVSEALFFGEDTTESFDPVDIFKKPTNHATAAASVLVFSANQADFHPNDKSAESLVPAYDLFVQKAATFPGFYLQSHTQPIFQLKNHTTVEEFEEMIRVMYSGRPHIEKIAFKIAGLVPLHQEDESLKNWILSLVVLDKPQGGNTVLIQLVRVNIRIAFDHTCTATKAYIPEQSVSINFSVFEVNGSFLSAHANDLATLVPIVDVEHMIALLASREPDAERLRVWLSAKQQVLSF